MSVKHLKLVSKGPHVDKKLSPNEIRVWHIPLFTYILLEIKGK